MSHKTRFQFRYLLLCIVAAAPLTACGGNASAIVPQPQQALGQPGPRLGVEATTQSNVATYEGCPVFTAGDYYNANVTSGAVDPHSAAYISGTISAGNGGGFAASTGVEFVNISTQYTPRLVVHPKAFYHPFHYEYPWLSTYRIEPLSDHHVIILDTYYCLTYEAWDTTYSDGTLSAYSGAVEFLKYHFQMMAAGQPSAMASGLSLFAGIVKWEEVKAGAIDHALDWVAKERTVSQWGYVWPASATDGLPSLVPEPYQIPYGAHLRLKASFNIATLSPEARIIAQAMKTYGIYLADTGSTGNMVLCANALNGTDPWNKDDLESLDKITLADFDVLQLPSMHIVPGH